MFIVSASPIEVVAPLARFLGVDDAIATRAKLDEDGRYTGEVEFDSHGIHKVAAMGSSPTRHHLDLEPLVRLLGLDHRRPDARSRRSSGGREPRP